MFTLIAVLITAIVAPAAVWLVLVGPRSVTRVNQDMVDAAKAAWSRGYDKGYAVGHNVGMQDGPSTNQD